MRTSFLGCPPPSSVVKRQLAQRLHTVMDWRACHFRGVPFKQKCETTVDLEAQVDYTT